MYNQPIFLKPAFQDRIWGGKKLQTLFDYDIPSNQTGEAWAISAHKNGPSEVLNGPLKGHHLGQVWEQHPELFGKNDARGEFPLLVKILDAADNLSVQVHPDDVYAREVEGETFGKTECWYVLDAQEGAEIVFGHHAASKEAFMDMVDRGEWDDLLRRVKVQKGDFFFVPSGTIHAIGKGIVILETQQSSDITYRVYDYDRKDADGNTRDLHIQSSAEVTRYPHDAGEQEKAVEHMSDKVEAGSRALTMTRLIQAEYFTVYHWKLEGTVETPLMKDYLLASVIEGKGEIIAGRMSFPIQKGDHFFLPHTVKDYELKGEMEIVVSHE